MSRPIPLDEMVKLFKLRHTTTHLFKIDNFSLLKKYEIERVESSVFDLGGHKWKLFVYPSGYNKTGRDHVSIFLANQFPTNVVVEFELFVVNQLQPTWHTHGKGKFNASSQTKTGGIRNFISLADLETKGYLIGDCCMVGVKFHGIEPAKSGTAECFSLIEKPLNHKVTWMMTKFSSFNPEKVHHSDEFVVGNQKWRIQVYPRGFEGEKDKSFSVFLVREGFIDNAPKGRTFAKFKLRVLDQVKRDHVEKIGKEWFCEKNKGFADFMPLEKLDKPYLVKDKLYVGVEFEVISMSNYC